MTVTSSKATLNFSFIIFFLSVDTISTLELRRWHPHNQEAFSTVHRGILHAICRAKPNNPPHYFFVVVLLSLWCRPQAGSAKKKNFVPTSGASVGHQCCSGAGMRFQHDVLNKSNGAHSDLSGTESALAR